jgi:hypothetical protein
MPMNKEEMLAKLNSLVVEGYVVYLSQPNRRGYWLVDDHRRSIYLGPSLNDALESIQKPSGHRFYKKRS